MIELKIPTNAAVIILTERMQHELDQRISSGTISAGTKLSDLEYRVLIKIAETATLDLIFLLPADILVEENNLGEIITRAFQSLSKVYGKEEFNNYSEEMAIGLLDPVIQTFKKVNEACSHFNN